MTETKKTTAKAASPAKAETSVSRQKLLGLPETPYFVQGNGETDTIKLSSIKYKNMFAKRTLSVLHLQRRLEELGYPSGDNGGYLGDPTVQAIKDYQSDEGLPATGEVDIETYKSVFKDDPNVVLDFD